MLWDPLGGVLCRLATRQPRCATTGRAGWSCSGRSASACSAARSSIGRRAAAWIASERGQQWIARGIVDRARRDRRDRRASRRDRGRARRGHRASSSRTATCSCCSCSASASARRRATSIARSAASCAVRRVVALLSRVGGGDAGAVSLPARRCCSRTIVLDYYLGHLDRAHRGSVAAQGARDRQPVLEPRHPGRSSSTPTSSRRTCSSSTSSG